MIKLETVRSSYTGRRGCMCGCNGKHRYASAFIEEATADRGYSVPEEDVSDRSVKMAVNKLNKLINWNDSDEVAKHVQCNYAWFDAGDRTTVVYFIN